MPSPPWYMRPSLSSLVTVMIISPFIGYSLVFIHSTKIKKSQTVLKCN